MQLCSYIFLDDRRGGKSQKLKENSSRTFLSQQCQHRQYFDNITCLRDRRNNVKRVIPLKTNFRKFSENSHWHSGSNLLFVFAQSSDHNEEDEDEVFERFMSEQLRYSPSGIDRDSSSIWKSSGRFAHKIQQKSIQIYANVCLCMFELHLWADGQCPKKGSKPSVRLLSSLKMTKLTKYHKL